MTRVLGLILLGVILTFLSVSATTDVVHCKADLRHVEFGYPWPFLVQSQETMDPPYPWTVHFSSVWEHPLMGFRPLAFMGDVAVFSAVCFAVVYGIEWVFGRDPKTKHPG